MAVRSPQQREIEPSKPVNGCTTHPSTLRGDCFTVADEATDPFSIVRQEEHLAGEREAHEHGEYPPSLWILRIKQHAGRKRYPDSQVVRNQPGSDRSRKKGRQRNSRHPEH